MLPLTFIAAISNEIANITILQVVFIIGVTAGCTNVGRLCFNIMRSSYFLLVPGRRMAHLLTRINFVTSFPLGTPEREKREGDEIRVERGQATVCSIARDGVVMTLKTERRKTTDTEL